MGKRGGVLFAVIKPFALLAFRWRQYQRHRRNFPTVFRTSERIASVDVAYFKELDPDFDGMALIDKLVAQRDEIVKSTHRWSFVSLLLSCYLLLANFSIELTLSIEGISLANSPGLREIAVLIIAMIGVWLLPRALNVVHLNAGIGALVTAYYPSNLHHFLRSAFFSTAPPPPYHPKFQPELTWRNWFIRLTLATSGFWLLFALGIFIVIIWARYTTYQFVWDHPTIDPQVTHYIVGLAALIDAAWISIQLLHMLPIPLTDWSRSSELAIAEEVASPVASKLSSALFGAGHDDRNSLIEQGYIVAEGRAFEDKETPTAPVASPHISNVLGSLRILRGYRASWRGNSSDVAIAVAQRKDQYWNVAGDWPPRIR